MGNSDHYGAGGGKDLPPFNIHRYTGQSSRANSGQTLAPLQSGNLPGNGPKPQPLEPPTAAYVDPPRRIAQLQTCLVCEFLRKGKVHAY